MKKYATVEMAKSTRIFISAFTWFFLRTVPSSRNAKPACIARTMIAPSRMNRTSEPCFSASISSSMGEMLVVGAFLGESQPSHQHEANTAPEACEEPARQRNGPALGLQGGG